MSDRSTTTPAAVPRELFGYEVIDVIGRGAGSVVYTVSDPATSQLYALKHVVVHDAKDERFVQQLETEYEVGQRVEHKVVRRSIDLKITRSLLLRPSEAALVLELFDGSPLDSLPAGSVPEFVAVFRRVAA